MNEKANRFKLVMFVLPLFLLVFQINLHPLINCNGAGGGYSGDDPDGSTGESIYSDENNIIEQYVIQAAANFLEANSNIQILLREIELSDQQNVDYYKLSKLATSAYESATKTQEAYIKLFQTAEVTPYNYDVIVKLLLFDYTAFRLKYSLNYEIFSDVSIYLMNGDINGVFYKAYRYSTSLVELSRKIKQNIDCNSLDISLLWQLNDTTSEMSLFGGYVARVFSVIN